MHEAMVLLGTKRLFAWLSLMAVSDLVELAEPHMMSTLARARLCQLLAERLRLNSASAFTVGVLSGVSEMLAMPIEELTTQLRLTDEVTTALVGTGGGLGTVLRLARDHAAGVVADTARLAVTARDLASDHLAALSWALRTYQDVLS